MPLLSPPRPPSLSASESVLPRAAGAGIPEGRTSAIGTLGGMFGKMSNAFFILPMIGGLLGGAAKLGKKGVATEDLTGLRGGLSKTSAVMRLPDVPTAELPKTISEVLPKSEGLANGVQSVGKYAQKMLSSNDFATRHELAGRLGEKSTAQLMVAASMTVGQTVGIVGDYFRKIKTVQRMEEAVTGKKPSRLTVLFGKSKLSQAVQEVRHREFWSLPSIGATGARLGGMGFGVRNMFTRNPSKLWVQIAGEMGLSAAASTLGNMNNGADSFQALERYGAADQIKEAPIEAYAGVIAGAAKGRIAAAEVQTLAEECKTKGLTAGQTFQFASDKFYGTGQQVAASQAPATSSKLGFLKSKTFLGATTLLTAAAGLSYVAMHSNSGKAGMLNRARNNSGVGAAVAG